MSEFIFAIVLVVLLIVASLFLIDSGSTCIENGGTLEFAYFQPMLVGKVLINTPIYMCNEARP